MAKIVTRDSFQALILRKDEVGMHAIGRALVLLLRRQTSEEQRAHVTKLDNQRGFTPADANSGSISAKYYMKHGELAEWQLARWRKPNAKGVARLAKYWAQINEEAELKQQRQREAA